MKEGSIYYLSVPKEGEDDLASPGFWKMINFDTAPFMFLGKKKVEYGYAYSWGEWVLLGYVDSMEHTVPVSEVAMYESRFTPAEDQVLLEAVKNIIQTNTMQALQHKEGSDNA